MESSIYTAKDLCTIIKACRDSGVTKIEFNGVNINFSDDVAFKWKEIPLLKIKDKSTIETEETPSNDEINYQMAIENPVEWEKMQLEGGLNGTN